MGTKLVRREGLSGQLAARSAQRRNRVLSCALRAAHCALIPLIILTACKPQVTKRPPTTAPPAPQIRATVITIETKIQPDNKTFTHTIVIAGDKARSLDEVDHWRLFDLKSNEVTFIDDIAKSYRVASLKSLLEERKKTMSEPLPDGISRATIAATRESKVLQGVNATLWTVRAGGYIRELWIGQQPAIPPNLFSMMVASDQPSTPLAPMMRAVDDALLASHGFPLVEHAELPYLNKKLVVDKTVTKIESKNVAASLLAVPSTFAPVSAHAAAPSPARPLRESGSEPPPR
jgi:hypothetical protein